MASYPTSVKTFTTKNTGDVIQAAHVNDLQDEVNAIEAGLRQGTAPLASSNSTVAALQAGNSTLGALTAGVSTLTDLVVVANPPASRIFHSTSLQVPNATLVPMNFDSIEFESTTGMHSTVSSSNFFLYAPSSGIYQVTLNVRWNNFSTVGSRAAFLRHNDVQIVAQSIVSASEAVTPTNNLSCLMRMQANDYVDVFVLQDSGTTGSLGITQSTARGFSDLAMSKLR